MATKQPKKTAPKSKGKPKGKGTTKGKQPKAPDTASAAEHDKKPNGRPPLYTAKLGMEIGEHIADGLSLRAIQALPGMPNKKTILRWALEDEGGFASIYARARELQLEGEADEIVDIADDGRNDWMERESRSGETFMVVDKEVVDRSKLRVETRKWRLSRLMQGKYGDKIEQTHKGDAAFLQMLKHVSGDSGH